MILSKRKIDWIIHSIYGVKKFHSLRSEFHSILTPEEWKFTTQRVESRPVHSIFTPKEVINDVTTQGVTSMTNRVKIQSIFFLESIVCRFLLGLIQSNSIISVASFVVQETGNNQLESSIGGGGGWVFHPTHTSTAPGGDPTFAPATVAPVTISRATKR